MRDRRVATQVRGKNKPRTPAHASSPHATRMPHTKGLGPKTTPAAPPRAQHMFGPAHQAVAKTGHFLHGEAEKPENGGHAACSQRGIQVLMLLRADPATLPACRLCTPLYRRPGSLRARRPRRVGRLALLLRRRAKLALRGVSTPLARVQKRDIRPHTPGSRRPARPRALQASAASRPQRRRRPRRPRRRCCATPAADRRGGRRLRAKAAGGRRARRPRPGRRRGPHRRRPCCPRRLAAAAARHLPPPRPAAVPLLLLLPVPPVLP